MFKIPEQGFVLPERWGVRVYNMIYIYIYIYGRVRVTIYDFTALQPFARYEVRNKCGVASAIL